jgi:periplasmic protein TonB
MSAKEDRLLLLLVLLGHALLFSLLAVQKWAQKPEPLAIELSLAAPEPTTQVQPLASVPHPAARPVPASKQSAQTPQPLVAPTNAPAPTIAPAPVPVPNPIPAAAVASAAASSPSQQQANNVNSSPTTSTQPKSAPAQATQAVLPNADAAYLTNPKPGYPSLSRRLGEQGVVILSVLVGEDGAVQKLEIAKSSSYPRLDEAASRAVQNWRFTPGKQAGALQAMWVKVPISFILEK